MTESGRSDSGGKEKSGIGSRDEDEDDFFVGELPSSGDIPPALPLSDQFSHSYMVDHRYEIPHKSVLGVKYEVIHSNGFIKLYTQEARTYWVAQNTASHTTPDWKFHFSVAPSDLPKAWNCVAAVFLRSLCRSGMKVEVNPGWPAEQFGREITIYIMTYDAAYGRGVEYPDRKSGETRIIPLSRAMEHSRDFWLSLVVESELALTREQVRSNGLARGDRAIGPQFSSIRNEAFVPQEVVDESSGRKDVVAGIPSNAQRWNAARHAKPFRIKTFARDVRREVERLSHR